VRNENSKRKSKNSEFRIQKGKLRRKREEGRSEK
jgi:hypothetical protein